MDYSLTDTYTIHSFDADLYQRATILSLCNYLQEIAWKHATSLKWGFEHLMEKNQAWVLSRMLLHVRRYPLWRESIRLTTWPRGVDRLFALREFECILPADTDGSKTSGDSVEDTSCLKATSSWIVIDTEKRKPRRPPVELNSIPEEWQRAVLDGNAPRIEPLSSADVTVRRRTAYSDLDVNGHVNNVAYLRWVIDALPPETLKNGVIETLSVNYLAEAMWNDELSIIVSSPDNGSPWRVEVRKEPEHKSLCRVELTLGKPRNER